MSCDTYLEAQPPKNIIFLHGGPGMDPSYFMPYCGEVNGNLYFYKQGSINEDANSIFCLVEELNQFIEMNNILNPILMGHSFGGALALEFIKEYPGKIKSLLLSCPVFSIDWVDEYVKNTPDGEDEYVLRDELSESDNYLEECMFYKDKYFHYNFTTIAESIFKKIDYNLVLRRKINESYLNKFDCTETVSSLEMKTLLIYGALDEVVFPAHIEKFYSLNSNILSHKFNNSKHFPFIEEKEKFTRIVNTFLQDI